MVDQEHPLDVPQLIRQRLSELALDQKDLAAAAQVTESYVSQLLARKKAPPAPSRTDLYERIGQFLRLPAGTLSRLAETQRLDELKKRIAEPPAPLFRECRSLILRKCHPARLDLVRPIFEKETFGELERLVTQKILDVAQELARDELRREDWLRTLAIRAGFTYEQMRVAVLEFLDSDVVHVSAESCAVLLDPMIEVWDIDLKSFAIDIVLNPRLAPASRKRVEFVEIPAGSPDRPEPGLREFLQDKRLSGDITPEELEFLRSLRLPGRRPAPLYYYRELQNLRDPLHFLTSQPPALATAAGGRPDPVNR